MDVVATKEQILLAKLQLHQAEQAKRKAILDQNFALATVLHEDVKRPRQLLLDIKNAILEHLSLIDAPMANLGQYTALQELLLEFHPVDFKWEVAESTSLAEINSTVAKYWQHRAQAKESHAAFLDTQYQDIRHKVLEFQTTGHKQEAAEALQRLEVIANMILRK